MGKGRRPCCDKAGVKKGPWSQAEDLKLISFIQKHGHSNWRALPKLAGLARCGKSCRLRWVNYLRPDLKRGDFTLQEEEAIIKLHQELGNKWSKIASKFPGRTDNEIKNVWNTHLKKRLKAKESNKDSSESCNKQSTSTSTDKSLDKNNKDNSKQNLIHQSSTTDDTVEHSSSSSTTSYTSQPPFPDLEMEDLGPIFDNLVVQDPAIVENVSSLDELIEIPFEPNIDLCDLLEGYQSNSADFNDVNFSEIDNALQVGPEMDKSSNDVVNKGEDDGGSWWWLVYLENELGLDHNEATSPTQQSNTSIQGC